MAQAAPLTRQERQQITDLHAEGWSLSRIATELGRSKSTIGKAAKAAGLQWLSTRTVAATEVKVAGNRDKRATLEGRLLDEAGLLLDQLHHPHLVYSFGGRDNVYEEHLLDAPDVGAKRALVAAATTAIGQAVKLAEVDRASSNAGEARGILGAFADGLAKAYEQLGPTEDAATPATLEG